MTVNVAIDFVGEAFQMDAAAPMGRQAAGEAFLRSWATWSGQHDFLAYVEDDAHGPVFVQRMAALAPGCKAAWASPRRIQPLEDAQLLFCFRPELAEHAWRRRAVGAKRYSLCGLTHTMSSHLAMSSAAQLLTAPLYPWDALICTSRAIRAAVRRLWEQQRDYLRERMGAVSIAGPELPVIPLGVETEAFVAPPGARAHWRGRFGIAEGDVAAIYVGRLSVHAKANPLPMLRALEQAACAAKQSVQLLLVGWFANDGQMRIFREAAQRLAPSVTLKLIDGRREELRRGAWAAADLFCQFADNIQESFGLAPVEAMAAGLPLAVSDWDGFRDSVKHGVQGFRIPTLAPAAGAGADLADRYASGMDSYDAYIGATSQFVAVDVEAATAILTQLLSDADLRARMGAAGREQARAHFDWRHVLQLYQELWENLAERRKAAAPEFASPATNWRPDRPDPFDIFSGFSSRRLAPDDLVIPGGAPWRTEVAAPGVALTPELLPRPSELEAIMRRLDQGPVTVAQLMAEIPRLQAQGGRGLVWLAKFDMVRVLPARS